MNSAVTKTDVVAIVVVDMLYDFIDGSMACIEGENAARKAAAFIDNNQRLKVFYVADTHPATHCSFKDYGGLWPAHCVEGSRGAKIHSAFYTLLDKDNCPQAGNIFRKGTKVGEEQYSGFNAETAFDEILCKVLPKKVLLCGIATEYCIKATCQDLLEAGKDVVLIEDALGYVTEEGHLAALEEMKAAGAKVMLSVRND